MSRIDGDDPARRRPAVPQGDPGGELAAARDMGRGQDISGAPDDDAAAGMEVAAAVPGDVVSPGDQGHHDIGRARRSATSG